MEEMKEITWESPEVSAEQLAQEQDANKEWLAVIRKQLAESRDIMREMIGRMTDEEVMELAELCLDEMENREYSVLRVCYNSFKEDSDYLLGVCGRTGDIASMLMYLCLNDEIFAKSVQAIAKELQERKEEFIAALEEAEEE